MIGKSDSGVLVDEIGRLRAEVKRLREERATLRAQLGLTDDTDPRAQAIALYLSPGVMRAIQDAGFVLGSGSFKQWILGRLAALEEARLTLAAEQGKAEGAPSGRWRFLKRGTDGWDAERWEIATVDRVVAMVRRLHDCRWESWVEVGPQARAFDIHETARAAMLAADKAIFKYRRTACINRAEALKADGVILWPPDGTHQQTPGVMLGYLRDPDLTDAVLAVYERVLFP